MTQGGVEGVKLGPVDKFCMREGILEGGRAGEGEEKEEAEEEGSEVAV